jgi:hypothetical protein
MEIYSYFVVWIDSDNKDRYSCIDIEVPAMAGAERIHELLIYSIHKKYEITSVEIKHVSFLKSSK